MGGFALICYWFKMVGLLARKIFSHCVREYFSRSQDVTVNLITFGGLKTIILKVALERELVTEGGLNCNLVGNQTS